MPDDHAHCPCVERLTAENEALRIAVADTIGILSIAMPRTEVPWLMDIGPAAGIALLAAERDALQARIDAALVLCAGKEEDFWVETPSESWQFMHDLRATLTGDTP